MFIQGVSRLEDITAGGDFLGLCDQKKLIKTCVRFWTVTELWAIFNSRTGPRVNRLSRNQLAGDVLNLAAYLLRCQHYFRHLTCAVHNRAAACVAAGGGNFENSFKHKSIQIKGNFTKLTLHLYFKCIMYYAGLLFCSVYCQ